MLKGYSFYYRFKNGVGDLKVVHWCGGDFYLRNLSFKDHDIGQNIYSIETTSRNDLALWQVFMMSGSSLYAGQ